MKLWTTLKKLSLTMTGSCGKMTYRVKFGSKPMIYNAAVKKMETKAVYMSNFGEIIDAEINNAE